jgi:hypothetical protein
MIQIRLYSPRKEGSLFVQSQLIPSVIVSGSLDLEPLLMPRRLQSQREHYNYAVDDVNGLGADCMYQDSFNILNIKMIIKSNYAVTAFTQEDYSCEGPFMILTLGAPS